MEKQWSRLEELIASSMDVTLRGPASEITSASEIAQQLTQEISSCARTDSDGRTYAPDQYTISLNPLDYDFLRQRAPQAHRDLSGALFKALNDSSMSFLKKPQVTLATDPTLTRNEVRVIAWHSSDPLQFTNEIDDSKILKRNTPPPGAFLIVEGKRHFPMTDDELTIGRRLDNNLILEDRHVSRSHARLEVIKGQYVIVDLDSTAGSRVNGRLITRHTLRPGDIISIAAVQLIYGEDPAGPPEATPPYRPPFDELDPDHLTPRDQKPVDKKTAPYNK
jgi:hypothetical protein